MNETGMHPTAKITVLGALDCLEKEIEVLGKRVEDLVVKLSAVITPTPSAKEVVTNGQPDKPSCSVVVTRIEQAIHRIGRYSRQVNDATVLVEL